MVDEDRYCIEILTQVSAVRAVLESVALNCFPTTLNTPIFEVNGHPQSELLAARRVGRIVAYAPMPPSSS